MRSHFVLGALIVSVWFIGGCQEESSSPPSPSTVIETESVEVAVEYDANSWKELISADCSSFFDGCNRCLRGPGREMAACTRKACAHYEAPRCLDEDEVAEPGAVIIEEPGDF